MKDLVKKAHDYAAEKHGDTKDDDGENFFVAHPCQVAEIIMSVSDDEDILAAAYLHDVVEDTPVTEEEVRKEFGDAITDLVMEVTHEGRKDAGGYYFPRLKTQKGIMLKFADRLSNLSRLKAWEPQRVARYLEKSRKAFPKEPVKSRPKCNHDLDDYDNRTIRESDMIPNYGFCDICLTEFQLP